MCKFEAYEDNVGGIYLFLLDAAGTAVAGFGNWEYGEEGELVDAINELERDPTAYESWGGDFGGDIEMPKYFEYDECGRFVAAYDMTVQELRDEYADNQCVTLIAWSDGDKIEYCDVGRMGFAARKVLRLSEDS